MVRPTGDHPGRGPVPAIPILAVVNALRRVVALMLALLLFQANWQGSEAACVTGHDRMHAVSGARASGADAFADGGHAGMTMAGAHHASGDGSAKPGSPSPGSDGTMPSRCPDFGVPASCAAMVACSAVALSPVTGLLLASEGPHADARLVEPEGRPLSLAAVPDVPPPRA